MKGGRAAASAKEIMWQGDVAIVMAGLMDWLN
jgi:hypothetical protein